jgi:hypothetical protein
MLMLKIYRPRWTQCDGNTLHDPSGLVLLIYQTLFFVVFEYFYDVYLFEIKHVCKLNWTKRLFEVLSFSVRRLLSITFHIKI